MKRLLLLGLLFNVVVLNAQSVDNVVRSVNHFSLRSYKEMSKSIENNNFVMSPMSVNMALQMVMCGAKLRTYDELDSVLCKYENGHDVENSARCLINEYNHIDICKLNIANGVWVQKDYSVLPSYRNTLQQSYGAKFCGVNFTKERDCRKAIKSINGWVASKTQGKVSELVSKNDITADCRMVLVNAIYFKCNWESKFKKSDSAEGVFNTLGGEQKKVMFMTQEHNFLYSDDDEKQSIFMPYENSRFGMLLILPRKGSFESVEKGLTADDVANIMSNMGDERVSVRMPKFKVESSCEMREMLKTLGIRDAFGVKADFSGITGNRDLYLSKVLHKAIIEVGEEGTEAAAATAAVMLLKSAFIPDLKYFDADRPFIYFIVDTKTKAILFVGRYVTV